MIFVFCFAHGQIEIQDSVSSFRPNLQIRVTDLPSLTAASTDTSDVLATALEIAFHDQPVCCKKDSALEGAVLSEARSMKELSAKVQGRHYLSDGQRIVVSAEFVPQNSINPGLIIATLLGQRAPLIEWKSHVYVLYGAMFNETRYDSGVRRYDILKLLLLDPRFSDQRRETAFDVGTDDFAKVQRLLTLSVARQ